MPVGQHFATTGLLSVPRRLSDYAPMSGKGGAFHFVVQSLQSVISGGVTFDLPPEAVNSPPSPNNAVFLLYDTLDDAQAAGYSVKVPLVTAAVWTGIWPDGVNRLV